MRDFQDYSKTYLDSNSSSSIGRREAVLPNSAKLLETATFNRIAFMLEANPSIVYSKSNGWHAMHYAAANPDSDVFKAVLAIAVKDEGFALPIVEKSKRGVSKGMKFLNFCVALDLVVPMAAVISMIPDFPHDPKSVLLHSLRSKSKKCSKFASEFFSVEEAQKIMLDYYSESYFSNATIGYRSEHFIREGLDNDMRKFASFGIDPSYVDESGNGFFLQTMRTFHKFRKEYVSSENLSKTIKSIEFFLKNGNDPKLENDKGESPRLFLEELSHDPVIGLSIKSLLSAYDKKDLSAKMSNDSAICLRKVKI